MKAAKYIGNKQFTIGEGEVIKPSKCEVRLEVAYCGVCGSDAPRIVTDAAHYYPIILGHEIVGRIVELGKGVTADSGDLQFRV